MTLCNRENDMLLKHEFNGKTLRPLIKSNAEAISAYGEFLKGIVRGESCAVWG